MAKDAEDEECPITFATFVKADLYSESDYPATDFSVQDVNGDVKFVTSTTRGDNLPLTSFKVEAQPCLDPSQNSDAPTKTHYPLERERIEESCSESEAFDPRYYDSGLKITEFEVQKVSGVLETLKELPLSKTYLDDVNEKKDIEYGFWIRPTISWRIECELEHPRD